MKGHRGGENCEEEGFFARYGRHGHRVVAVLRQNGRCLRAYYTGFLVKHPRIDMLVTTLGIAVSVPAAWWLFALLLNIPFETVRAVAIWLFLISLVVAAAAKSYGERARDRIFG